MTEVWQAIEKGSLGEVIRYLEEGQDINALDHYGATLLMHAVSYSQVAIIKKLLEMGADLEKKSMDTGLTALLFAVRLKQLEIIQILLEAGADVDTNSRGGWTPLFIAADEDDTEMMRLLLRHGANIHKGTEGWLPVQWAEMKKHLNIVSMLKAEERWRRRSNLLIAKYCD